MNLLKKMNIACLDGMGMYKESEVNYEGAQRRGTKEKTQQS